MTAIDPSSKELADFITGFLESALWTDSLGEEFCAEYNARTGEDRSADQSILDVLSPDDVSAESRERVAADCARFMEENGDDLDAYCAELGDFLGTDTYGSNPAAMARAGHDFWLTRNGHGVGFWDRDLGELGERLTEACKTYPELSAYPFGDSVEIS